MMRYLRHLRALHAPNPRCHWACNLGPPVRNLLEIGAMSDGATVPIRFFTALTVQFYGTLTPFARKLHIADADVACFLGMLGIARFSLMEKKERTRTQM